ncbi:MAG: hypothetical protein K6B41_02820 [Butyrivibrio sp.]|nr:hypothetical protein [Butyrivibrio sp.]
MATNIKKLIALGVLSAALTTYTITPAAGVVMASEQTTEAAAEGTETAETAEGETAEQPEAGAGAEANGETVNEDGEVIMEGATGKVAESEWITIDDYEMVAESDTYKMYYYEPRLSVILENKSTGKFLETTLSDELDDGASNTTWNAYMKSGIVLSAIIGTTNTYQVDMISTSNKIETTKIDNGVSAKIYWNEYKFGLTVNITLEGDNLVVNVPDDSIVEEKEGTYISTVSLFPFMGYTYMDDQNGYMLVPDGNGALIYLDNKEGRYSTGFSQMIYGTDAGFTDSSVSNYLWSKYDTVVDTNDIIAPVFGMAHTDDQLGYLAIVEEGEKRASVEAHPNGVMVNYNRCFAKFMVRDIYVQPLNQSNSGTMTSVEADRTHTDLQVRYMLLENEAADYSGMAVAYRNYLLDNNLVQIKDTGYNTRVDFLGSDREEFLMGTKSVPMTTTDNIEEIYSDLQSAGVSSLLSVYKGWQKGGIYNVPITSYKADSSIGGTGSLTSLIKNSADNGYNIYLYNDALRVNARTNTTTFNVVKKINKRTLKEEVNEQVYDLFYYLLPGKMQSTLQKFVKSYTNKGVNNLALAGVTDNIFSFSSQGSYYTRYDTANAVLDTVAGMDENVDLVLEQPFAYLWDYTDAFLDMPLGSSDYMYVDEEVPFLSMVLKGIIPMYSDYVNFEANKTEFFLQMVESGVYPSFYVTYENSSALIYTNSSDLYSTEYSTYRDSIISYDTELRAVANAVEGAHISDHEKMDNGVTKVTYDNGTVIYVNYTNESVSVDGLTVDAMSYQIK